MSQQTTFLSLGCLTKRTRADRFLDEMSRVVLWAELAAVVAPHYQPASTGRKDCPPRRFSLGALEPS